MPVSASIVIPIRHRTERDLAPAIPRVRNIRSLASVGGLLPPMLLLVLVILIQIVLILNSLLARHAGPFNCSHFAS